MKYFENIFIIIVIVIVSGLFIARQGEFYVEDFKSVYQELDNTNDFYYYDFNYVTIINSEGISYIDMLLAHLSPTEHARINTLLIESTDYTLIYKIYQNDYPTRLVLMGGYTFDYTILESTLGVHSVLVTTKSEILLENNMVYFAEHAIDYDEPYGTLSIGFRAVLFEGDLTGLTEVQKLDLIENAEYGDYLYDDSYYYMDDLTMDSRIDNITTIFFTLIVIVILGSIGFIMLKKK